MNFTPFLRILDILKILHWTTLKHSHHVVLQDAYDDLGDKIDEFIETYIGTELDVTYKYNPSKTQITGMDIKNPLQFFMKEYREFETEMAPYVKNDALKNVADDMATISKKLCYLLRMS